MGDSLVTNVTKSWDLPRDGRGTYVPRTQDQRHQLANAGPSPPPRKLNRLQEVGGSVRAPATRSRTGTSGPQPISWAQPDIGLARGWRAGDAGVPAQPLGAISALLPGGASPARATTPNRLAEARGRSLMLRINLRYARLILILGPDVP